MNCIDCIWAIQEDENRQCKKASPEIRECEGYKSAKRKIIKLEENENFKIKILCDKIDELCRETNEILDKKAEKEE